MGYKKQFVEGTTPKLTDLSGEFVVRYAPPILPEFRVFRQSKVFPANVDKEPVGHNRFFKSFKMGNFNTELVSAKDGLEVALINYQHKSNPFFIRALKDELREISPGNYLGRGIYSFFGLKVKVMYFTVRRE